MIGPLVFLIYWIMRPFLGMFFGFSITSGFPILVYYGIPLLFLGAMFALQKRFWCPDISFVGSFSKKDVIFGVVVISALYLTTYLVAYLMKQPREPAMVSLFAFRTGFQNIVFCVSVLVLPPIVEELAFRHFLLSTVPFRASTWISLVGVMVTALLFSLGHGYIYFSTKILIFAVGITFGIARIRSHGLLLPIGLHVYAVAFALICNQIVASLEG